MATGVVAMLVALGLAVWVVIRLAHDNDVSAGDDKPGNGFLDRYIPSAYQRPLRWVLALALVTILLANRLWPLAFMVVLAIGGIAAIEFWRSHSIKLMQDLTDGMPEQVNRQGEDRATAKMDLEEAQQILGLDGGTLSRRDS